MISKFLQKSAFVISCLLVSFSVKAQSDDVFLLNQILVQTEINDKNYFYFGNINLTNNEVLTGNISLNNYRNGQYTAILKTEDSCQYIPNTEIETVELFNNDDNFNQSTRFITLQNKQKLYRELHVKDSKNAIYDSMEKPFDGKVMSGIYVLENNSLHSIYNFWHSGPKADLLNYFEDRDHKKYKRRDYKNLERLFAQL